MKGMGKALARTPFQLTSKVGMSKKSHDAEFDNYNERFTTLEEAAAKLIKDTKVFSEALVSLFTAGEGFATHFATVFQPILGEYDLIGRHPEAGHTIRNVLKYQTAMEELKVLVAPELELVETRIMGPAKELQSVMKLIRKTITKRDHKLVDYDRFNNSLTKLRDKKDKSLSDEKNLFKLEQDFEIATSEYEYINNALKQDLPRFLQLATLFIDPLFNSFYYMQLNIYYLLLEKMTSFAEENKFDIANQTGASIAQEYEEKRTDAYATIENLGIIKRIVSVSRMVQTQRSQGTLSRSSTVASGSTAGGLRVAAPPSRSPSATPSLGYKKPAPAPPSPSFVAAPPPYTAAPASISSASSVAATKRAPPPPPPLKPKPKPAPQIKYVVALYDFQAQADGDLSFNAGDKIELVRRSDSAEDWWTGKLNGVEGVFPGNYVQE